jgi:hypothetical protein
MLPDVCHARRRTAAPSPPPRHDRHGDDDAAAARWRITRHSPRSLCLLDEHGFFAAFSPLLPAFFVPGFSKTTTSGPRLDSGALGSFISFSLSLFFFFIITQGHCDIALQHHVQLAN